MPRDLSNQQVVTRFSVHTVQLRGDTAIVRPCLSSELEVTLHGVVPVPQGNTDMVAFQYSPTEHETWLALEAHAGELIEVIGTGV